MSKVLCVTNRKLCGEDLLTRVERIAQASPAGIILREKDLPEAEYQAIAEKVMDICRRYDVPCILHSFADAAIALNADAIHLPMPLLRSMTGTQKAHFKQIGASCHSIADALEAEKLGCTYLTAGHIFATECKQGIPGRGPGFLRQVCGAVSVPVFAIGGIGPETIGDVLRSGAAGACVMSGLMTCADPQRYMKELEHEF